MLQSVQYSKSAVCTSSQWKNSNNSGTWRECTDSPFRPKKNNNINFLKKRLGPGSLQPKRPGWSGMVWMEERKRTGSLRPVTKEAQVPALRAGCQQQCQGLAKTKQPDDRSSNVPESTRCMTLNSSWADVQSSLYPGSLGPGVLQGTKIPTPMGDQKTVLRKGCPFSALLHWLKFLKNY